MSLKEKACNEIDNCAEDLNRLSQAIWTQPELEFEEIHAHKVLTDFLEAKGFSVQRHYKLDTAFRAECGDGDKGPNIAFLCEYDALPELGHACGHNLIAEVGVAAGIGVKAAFEAAGKPLGKVTILGTPAEEEGGGKIDLIQAHAFEDVDVAMMAHPSYLNFVNPVCLVVTRCTVKYYGKAIHAAGFPWDGVNALNAAVLGYQNVACLRQEVKPSCRIHGIISHGGAKASIIPDFTELKYRIWAPTQKELAELKAKVVKCFKSAAEATGCTVQIDFFPKIYLDLYSNETLTRCCVSNAEHVQMKMWASESVSSEGSTDMGNVSHVVPSIHPYFFVGRHAEAHTVEFREAAGSFEAQVHTLEMAKVLAMTAIDAFTSQQTMNQIKTDFKKDIESA